MRLGSAAAADIATAMHVQTDAQLHQVNS